MTRISKRVIVCALFALTLGLVACNDEGSSTSSDAAPTGDVGSNGDAGSTSDGGEGCVRDDTRLAARTECFRDEDCPCGAHCALGLCESSCRDDANCDDALVCDPFGRCRGAAVAALLPGAR